MTTFRNKSIYTLQRWLYKSQTVLAFRFSQSHILLAIPLNLLAPQHLESFNMKYTLSAIVLLLAQQSLAAPAAESNHLEARQQLPPGTPVPYPGFAPPAGCNDVNEFVKCALRTPATFASCSVLPGYSVW